MDSDQQEEEEEEEEEKTNDSEKVKAIVEKGLKALDNTEDTAAPHATVGAVGGGIAAGMAHGSTTCISTDDYNDVVDSARAQAAREVEGTQAVDAAESIADGGVDTAAIVGTIGSGLAHAAKLWINADDENIDSKQAQAQKAAVHYLKFNAATNYGMSACTTAQCKAAAAMGGAASKAAAAGGILGATTTGGASNAAAAGGILGTMTLKTKIALGIGALLLVTGAVVITILLTRHRGVSEGAVGVPRDTPRPTLSPTITCGVNPDILLAQGIIHMKGLPRTFTEKESMFVEAAFVDAYNNVSKGCDDKYQRFVQWVNITNQSAVATEPPYLDTRWSVSVECNGCPISNPLFREDEPYRPVSFDRNLQGAEENDVLLVDFIKVFNATLRELANSGKIDYAYEDIAFGTFNNVSQDPFIESSSQPTSAPTKEQSISPTDGPVSLPTKSPTPQRLRVLTEPPTTMPTSTSTPTTASTAGPTSRPTNSLTSELPSGPAVSPTELPTTGSTTTE